jgi:hypothetical protein
LTKILAKYWNIYLFGYFMRLECPGATAAIQARIQSRRIYLIQ